MRYLSLFSGIEAASCAWQPLGWALKGVCEIEKFPCNVLKYHYPDVPNIGDITKLTREKLEALGPIDLIVGGSPCFTADTLVTTDHGPVPICDIEVGDIVLTHKGRWQKVLRIGHKQAETIYVKGQGAILHCTRNHPIWARGVHSKWNNDKRVYEREPEPMDWVPAEELDHMYWGALTKSDKLEVPQPYVGGQRKYSFNPTDLNILELAGRYLADGCVYIRDGLNDNRRGDMIIACGEYRRYNMDDLAERTGLSYTPNKERTVIKYVFHSIALAEWLRDNFGRGAENKYVPSWVYGLNTSQKAALMKGYLDGDGYRKTNRWKCSTISKKLAVGIKMLAEHLGVSVSMSFVKKEPTYVIEGRTVNQHSYWELALYDKARSSFELDDYRWGLVRKIIPGKVETVYNLEVETDNSYIADGICSHNCQGFSAAGKQGGLNDVRSRLAIDYIRVINTVKPRWIVWENVPGVFSTNKGMDLRYFTEVLTRSGYGLCWRVLDAQYARVSQRRRRVFLVGYLGDWRPAYEVLFESQSLPRYLKTLERKREDLARKAEARTGKTGTGTTCLNPWSEQSKRVLDINGKSDCLCASEKMRSITKIFDDRGTAACMGYGKYVETEKAETLRASGGDLGGGSENICYDMAHPVDVIRTYEDGKTPTLEARMGTGGNNIPLVQDRTLYLEHQYFATHEGKASTLTRDIYRDPPAVLKDEKDPLCCDVGWLQTYENKAPTQLARQYKDPPIVLNEAYRIGSYYSNSMQSDNPNSGIYQTDKSATLQTADPTPACQQGGIAVIQGSVIGRKVENGPQGSGINIDKCFTLNTTDRHAVCSSARVRKLTPTECLRLQGFPDDWFEGVDGYSDTAAYKAIGNSMAVPCMRWIGERIDTVEKELQNG